jgi:hypothetical protein
MKRKPHTWYPIFWHHSIISGIASSFKLRPDFRIASTIEKFDCNELRAAMASCRIDEHPWEFAGTEIMNDTPHSCEPFYER